MCRLGTGVCLPCYPSRLPRYLFCLPCHASCCRVPAMLQVRGAEDAQDGGVRLLRQARPRPLQVPQAQVHLRHVGRRLLGLRQRRSPLKKGPPSRRLRAHKVARSKRDRAALTAQGGCLPLPPLAATGGGGGGYTAAVSNHRHVRLAPLGACRLLTPCRRWAHRARLQGRPVGHRETPHAPPRLLT